MTAEFEQFIKERQFISNVSPRTVEWYRQSLAWLDNPEPTNDQLKALVIRMRERGLKATTRSAWAFTSTLPQRSASDEGGGNSRTPSSARDTSHEAGCRKSQTPFPSPT